MERNRLLRWILRGAAGSFVCLGLFMVFANPADWGELKHARILGAVVICVALLVERVGEKALSDRKRKV